MTETERALLRAIHDDPDDDAVRLVYADFLEEAGDLDRAEFIRLQITRSRERGANWHFATERETELLTRHFDDWTREAQPFDPERTAFRFRRGFIWFIRISRGKDEDLVIFRRLPGLQSVYLQNCKVSAAGLEHVTTLRHLRSLGFYPMEIDAAGQKVLESLPCWARIECYDSSPDDSTWAAFHERRLRAFDLLSPPERRQAAQWFLSGLTQQLPPITQVSLCLTSIVDAEIRFFAEVPDLEMLYLSEQDSLTSAGIRHLDGLPNLKSVTISETAVDSIRPLMNSPTLESLKVSGSPLNDAGTEGLDRLVELRSLELRSDALGDATITRLQSLAKLRELKLSVGPLADLNCLEVLAGLTELESLSINGCAGQNPDAGLDEEILRHVVPLHRLQSLALHLGTGNGEGLRHLAGLSELRVLQLHGSAVNDSGIMYLASLPNLRTLFSQPSGITEAGARTLVARLPAVTIITREHVFRSPRQSTVFSRRLCGNWVSALIPEDWQLRCGETKVHAQEPGWESIADWSWGGPAIISLSVNEITSPPTVEERLQEFVVRDSHLNPQILERCSLTWPEWETASCVYEDEMERHLACVAIQGNRVLVLNCDVVPARFESFRPLFLFIAHSIRVGDSASEGVDEVIEVPVSEIERAAT